MNNEKERRNSTNKFELEGNVGSIGDMYINSNGKQSLRFDLGQNNNDNTQFVPILLRGNLVNSYGNEIKKGDWITVKGIISTYSKEVYRNDKVYKEKAIDILGFEIEDHNKNMVYKSDGTIDKKTKDNSQEIEQGR